VNGQALLGYAARWLAIGVVATLVILAVLSLRPDEVSLPPLRQTELSEAARAARCVLDDGRTPLGSQPPASGPPARAARPRSYARAPSPESLVGAIRRGIVVIHYRPALGEEERERLEELQLAIPAGTIVTPNAEMPYLVAVTAWRRRLGCERFEATTVDAIRLFRGRFIGLGPER